ncbi:uncharacterized protein LOC114283840 [Camellia sinensis]|uniref:uncharacterized protein LOC114283840 n=1 Tax=Camellia sinensis TaxID=4442 RepID=UPI001036DCFE|nr:uncharacterized protein LOC114283840 [Camellia sinensis]
MWLRDERCEEVVKATWGHVQEVTMDSVRGNLEKVSVGLSQWDRTTFGHVQQLIRTKLSEVRRLDGQDVLSTEDNCVRRNLCCEIDELLERDEALWCQRARANWLKEGDRNTSFFHSKASQRHKKKRINGLENDEGEWCTKPEELEKISVGFFEDLFLSEHLQGIGDVLDKIHMVVSPAMNAELARVYRAKEGIGDVLDKIHMAVSPAMNAELARVYRAKEVTQAVLGILNDRKGVTTVNDTFLVLIPKVKNPKRMSQFRPISLCNVAYKIGLSSLITRAEEERHFTGVAVCRGCPHVSHLFFADDSLIFGVATVQELTVVKDILGKYELASGQKINLEKSAICFSKNVAVDTQEVLRTDMGVGTMVESGKYLGMPYIVGRSKREMFNYVKDRVWKRLNGWKEKYLSAAGREVLIKSVAQSIPTYIMSCFQLPDGLCGEIDSMVSNYWWGQRENKRKIHWKSWRALCDPKWMGGMGFRCLKAFNTAMLAKQGWRLMSSPDSLLAKILKAKYYPTAIFFQAGVGSNPSFTWRGIINARPLLEAGVRTGDVGIHSSYMRILWQWTWKPFRKSLSAVKMSLSLRKGKGSGSEGQHATWFWKRVWHLRIPNKIKVFAWKCCSNILPIKSILRHWHLISDATCTGCGDGPETLMHCFGCPMAQEVWHHSPLMFVLDKGVGLDFMSWAYEIGRSSDADTLGLFFAICWGMWSSRNAAIFNSIERSAVSTIQMVSGLL